MHCTSSSINSVSSNKPIQERIQKLRTASQFLNIHPPVFRAPFLYFIHRKKILIGVITTLSSAASLWVGHWDLCPALVFQRCNAVSLVRCRLFSVRNTAPDMRTLFTVSRYLGCIQKNRAVLQKVGVCATRETCACNLEICIISHDQYCTDMHNTYLFQCLFIPACAWHRSPRVKPHSAATFGFAPKTTLNIESISAFAS